jgi:hypothetical protein
MVADTRHPNIQPMLGGLGQATQVLYVPKKKSRKTGQQISIASSESVGNRDTMGSHNIFMYGDGKNTSSNLWQPFQVERLDAHFSARWKNEALGFAHFDTEGNELDVLIGGAATIRRDAPVFTVCHETRPNYWPSHPTAWRPPLTG